MGSQDTLFQAEQFQDITGTESFLMTWDQSFASWIYYDVSSQPTIILVNANGEPIKGWRGSFPEDEVLELAASA